MPGAQPVRTLALLTLGLAAGLLLGRVAAAQVPTSPGPGAARGRADEATALKNEAAALIRAGDIAAARERYRRALDVAPGDVEALFGYARTSAWTQDYGAAEQAYLEGLARAPRSVEGLLGLADVLAWTQRYDAALARVAEAEAVSPQDPEVWRRRGRFNRWRGDLPAARAAYVRTLELARDDPEAARALVEMAAETTAELDLAYTREDLSPAKARRLGTDANTLAAVQYAYSGISGLTLLGRVNYSDRFGDDELDDDDFQATGGLAWRLQPRTTLRLEVSLAPDADTFPAFAGEIELLQGVGLEEWGTAVLGAGYRYLDFNRVVRFDDSGALAGVDPSTTAHIISPSVEWTTPWPLVLLFRYYYSVTDFEPIPAIGTFPGLAGGDDRTSSGLLKATFFPEARVVPFVAYARGVESFSTAAQLRGLTTDTYAAGLTLRLTPSFGIRAAYEYLDSGKDTAGGTITQQNLLVGTYVRW